jgi:ABC-2 type transport system ATP-binding protein
VLEVSGLSKFYNALPAVRDVTFTVRPGEVLGYLGPNGSGKSTTVKMLVGLLVPTQGTIRFNGADIQDDLIAHKARVGYVPEEPHLYAYLTGPEYLTLIGRLRRVPAAALAEKVEGFMRLFRLESEWHTPLAAYSKGMRQKVLISAAVLHDPEIVIFDEPFSGLDVTTMLVLKTLVQTLAREGRVVIYSSHVLEVVEQICQRVVILHRGNVVAHDSVAHLRDLMRLPSLEAVFSQLAVQEDVEQTADAMVALMKR